MTMEQDYLLRQIQMLIQGIARIFFRREARSYAFPEARQDYTLADQWYDACLERLRAGDINGAENRLFAGLIPGDSRRLQAALDFYDRLSALGDEELGSAGFSRQEILRGLEDLAALYGVDLAEK